MSKSKSEGVSLPALQSKSSVPSKKTGLGGAVLPQLKPQASTDAHLATDAPLQGGVRIRMGGHHDDDSMVRMAP